MISSRDFQSSILQSPQRDVEKMLEYYRKGSDPWRLARSVKDIEKAQNRAYIAKSIAWDEAYEAFTRRVEELGGEGSLPPAWFGNPGMDDAIWRRNEDFKAAKNLGARGKRELPRNIDQIFRKFGLGYEADEYQKIGRKLGIDRFPGWWSWPSVADRHGTAYPITYGVLADGIDEPIWIMVLTNEAIDRSPFGYALAYGYPAPFYWTENLMNFSQFKSELENVIEQALNREVTSHFHYRRRATVYSAMDPRTLQDGRVKAGEIPSNVLSYLDKIGLHYKVIFRGAGSLESVFGEDPRDVTFGRKEQYPTGWAIEGSFNRVDFIAPIYIVAFVDQNPDKPKCLGYWMSYGGRDGPGSSKVLTKTELLSEIKYFLEP